MDLFLALFMIVVFTLGYFLMTKLDRIFDSPKFLSVREEAFYDNKSYILVFGYSKITKRLIEILVSQKLDYIVIDTEDQLNKSISYSYLYAISDNDYSNLIISLIGIKTLGIEQVVAVCNNIENKPIFEQNKIQFIQIDENSAERLYRVFFPSISKVTDYD